MRSWPVKSLVCAALLLSLVPVDAEATGQATPKVGVAAAVNSSAFGTPPGGNRKTLVLGDNVIYRHRIETEATGLVQVLLVDGSTFTVGANSNLVIDEFVYDPNAGNGKLVATLGKGVARFIGGRLSKQDGGVSINTPVGTIGIRGGIANLNVGGNGGTFSLIFGDELTFTGTDGSTNRVYQPGYSLQVGNGDPTGGNVRRTTQSDLGSVQQSLSSRPGQSGGQSSPPGDGTVQQSGFGSSNSGLGTFNTQPPPDPNVVRSTEFGETDSTLLQIQQMNQERNTDVIEANKLTMDAGEAEE